MRANVRRLLILLSTGSLVALAAPAAACFFS